MIRRLLEWLDLDRWNDGWEAGYAEGWADARRSLGLDPLDDPDRIDPGLTDDLESRL